MKNDLRVGMTVKAYLWLAQWDFKYQDFKSCFMKGVAICKVNVLPKNVSDRSNRLYLLVLVMPWQSFDWRSFARYWKHDVMHQLSSEWHVFFLCGIITMLSYFPSWLVEIPQTDISWQYYCWILIYDCIFFPADIDETLL